MSVEDYDAMLASQHGACAICNRKPGKRLAVDHCHVTGKVRGLLCAKCNSGLAFFQDNPDYILAAIEYLEASRAGEEMSPAATTQDALSPDGVAAGGRDGGQPECNDQQHRSGDQRNQNGDI